MHRQYTKGRVESEVGIELEIGFYLISNLVFNFFSKLPSFSHFFEAKLDLFFLLYILVFIAYLEPWLQVT